MDENRLAVSTNRSLMPIGSEWEAMKSQADVLVKSGFLPDAVTTPEKAIAIMLKGRELDIPPMQALSQINIIKGKPTISAELMLALCYRAIPGFKAEPTEDTDKAFTIRLTRPGMLPYLSRFTIEDATKAGLTSKDGGMYSKYPKAMLRARAVSAGLRLYCPDAISGMSYTPEEMGAVVDENGEIISVESTDVKQPEQPVTSQPEAVEGDFKLEPEPIPQEPNQQNQIPPCGECGGEITAVTTHRGKPEERNYTPGELVEFSTRDYGFPHCYACSSKKWNEKKKAEKGG